ncbi:hypothetical protein [Micromonospora sp. WMMD987]|uniref:hypothetical protein n=1 Tax=Micromonospora sp. WMMD987 TaxID=3016089 RepID=UPI00249C5B55|nr:hypothetical protein [Micromonospora sp. WMMD987]WFE93504.1 hypothetical protein O7612_19015 [Micromonospora sp. WMMD987]
MIEGWLDRLSRRWARPEDPMQPVAFPAELRSCHAHIAFDATFELWWKGNDETAIWTTRQRVTEWADQVTAQYCVTQAGNAENEINSRNPYGARVQLVAGPQARLAAEAILDIDRQTALERVKQQAELERIRYLRESVYSRPDVARSYWLYHHPDRPEELLTIRFEEIAEKFGNVGESRSLVIAKLIGDFLGRLEDGERRYLIEQLGQIFSSYDRPDLAERLEDS